MKRHYALNRELEELRKRIEQLECPHDDPREIYFKKVYDYDDRVVCKPFQKGLWEKRCKCGKILSSYRDEIDYLKAKRTLMEDIIEADAQRLKEISPIEEQTSSIRIVEWDS